MRKINFLITFFLISGCFSYAQDSLNTEIPAEMLFKQYNQHNFSISPDGKYFVEVVQNNIENDIVILDIDGYVVYNEIPLGRKPVENIYWLTSKRLLYESRGGIYAIDIDGTNAKLIVNRMADVPVSRNRSYYDNFRINTLISLLPSKKHQVLIETYDMDFNATIKEVNIFTGQKYTVINGELHKMNHWVLDFEGNIRLGVRFSETGLTYLIKNPNSDNWNQFYVKIDGRNYPLTISAKTFLNQNLTFEGFGFDPDIIYLTSNINSDKRKLVSYNIKTKSVIEVLVEDVNCDVKEPDDDEFAIIFDYLKGEVAGVRYQGIVPEYKWLSSSYKALHDSLNKKYPRFINDLIDVDGSGNRFVIYQWSDISAGNIGIYDVNKNSYSVMFHFNSELNKYKLSKTINITTLTRDGVKIPCYLTLPNDYDVENPIPLVVIPHGGPWVRDYWRLDEFSQYFTSRGYATLRVNFRGSTGFGKKHVLAGVSSIDNVMINDIADAVMFLTEHYSINKKEVFIYGHSYGGYATYMSLLKYPDLFTAGVAVSAPTDIREWIKKQKRDENYFTYEFWNTALGNRKSRYLDDLSPLSYAKDFKKPLLIFHGQYDKNIPLEQAEDMIRELKKNNKDAELEIMRGEGHSISDSYSIAYILDKSYEFFQKNVTEE